MTFCSEMMSGASRVVNWRTPWNRKTGSCVSSCTSRAAKRKETWRHVTVWNRDQCKGAQTSRQVLMLRAHPTKLLQKICWHWLRTLRFATTRHSSQNTHQACVHVRRETTLRGKRWWTTCNVNTTAPNVTSCTQVCGAALTRERLSDRCPPMTGAEWAALRPRKSATFLACTR